MRRSPVLLALSLGLIVPATASAATVTVSGGTPGNLTFQAALGEANDVGVADFLDPVRGRGLTVTDAGAPITFDATCDAGPPRLCPVRPVAVHLGDRGDRATVITHVADASVWGDSGNDDIVSSGVFSFASGGPGHDRLRVNSNADAVAYGGGGNDEIDAASAFRARAYGGSGSDLIVQGLSAQAILDGGSGPDTIVGLPQALSSVEAHGGGGADVLTIQAEGGNGRDAAWTLTGDDGDDVITGGPGADTISGDAGRDRIFAAGGGADSVQCGSGHDVVKADAEDTVAADCEVVRITIASAVSSRVSRALRRAAALAAR